MITCYLKYTIDPYKLKEFEHYAQLWVPIVNKFGGCHLGFFLPCEGASNIAMALFNFASMHDYEIYRIRSQSDLDCIAANNYAQQTRCIESYERSFFKPLTRV